jgi:hypothetical protein
VSLNKLDDLIVDRIIIELALCGRLQLLQRANEHKVHGLNEISRMNWESHVQVTTVTQKPEAAL